MSNIKLHFRE